jgi:hypothetical protein
VTVAGIRSRALRAPILLGALLLVALGIRLLAVGAQGHVGDVSIVSRWAERMAEVGPLAFYAGDAAIYPALLYVYWPLGVAFDGDALHTAIKGLSIPFDLAIGGVLYAVVAPRAGRWAALGAAALYLLNPAVILAGPVWGQIDAAGTLVFLAALVAASRQRWTLAAGLGVLAGLVKPQFGFVLLPIAVLVGLDVLRSRRARPLVSALAGGLGAYLVVCGPLLLDPFRHLQNVVNVMGIRPEASVLAPNIWALLVGYGVPDAPYAGAGAALLVVGLLDAQLPLRSRRDLRTLLAVGAFVVFASYFLPTRVHERYLFPAMALLAPLAAVSRTMLAAYVALSAAFALSLVYALVEATPFELPAEWQEVLLSKPMLWGMAITLMAAAATVVIQHLLGADRPLRDPDEVPSAPRG